MWHFCLRAFPRPSIFSIFRRYSKQKQRDRKTSGREVEVMLFSLWAEMCVRLNGKWTLVGLYTSTLYVSPSPCTSTWQMHLKKHSQIAIKSNRSYKRKWKNEINRRYKTENHSVNSENVSISVNARFVMSPIVVCVSANTFPEHARTFKCSSDRLPRSTHRQNQLKSPMWNAQCSTENRIK